MSKKIEKNNNIKLYVVAGVALAVLFGIVGIAKAFDFWGDAAKQAGNRAYEDNKESLVYGGSLGAPSADGYCSGDESIIQIGCNTRVQYLTSEAITTGSLTASGAITGLDYLSTVSTRVASTTLTNADSGKTFILTTTTEFVLPSTSTSAGVHYKFVIGSAITANATIRTSDLGNNIEGTLIVAGAVVDCASEDMITFVADGENVGDYVELWSNGTYWFIGDSGVLTSGKMTCTADGS